MQHSGFFVVDAAKLLAPKAAVAPPLEPLNTWLANFWDRLASFLEGSAGWAWPFLLLVLLWAFRKSISQIAQEAVDRLKQGGGLKLGPIEIAAIDLKRVESAYTKSH